MAAKQTKATAGGGGTHYLEFGQGKTTTTAAAKKVGGASVAGDLMTAAPTPAESTAVAQSAVKKVGAGQSVAPAANKKTLLPPPTPPPLPKVGPAATTGAGAGGVDKKKVGAPLDNYMQLEQKPADKLEPINRLKVTRAQPTKRPKSMQPTQQMSRTSAAGAEAGASQYPEAPAPTARPSTQKFTGAKKMGARKPGPSASYFRRIRDYYQRPRQDRRVAELLELFVASRQGTPELCPRITAVVLVWLIIFVPIMVHTATNTDYFSSLGMLIGTTEVTSEKNWCYLETSLYENPVDCCHST